MESSKNRSVTFRIGGMTCINCQTKIEKRLLQLNGILYAEVSWKKGSAEICFDETKISLEEIISEIEKLDYKVIRKGGKSSALDSLLYAGIIALLFFALQKTGVMNLLVPGSIASSKMSYALLFVTGLLTSVHCVAMCGGINLSQSLSFVSPSESSSPSSRKIYLPSLLYNLGRLASYTFVGLVLGSVGFFLGGRSGGAGGDVSIPLSVQGCLKLIAGLFMLLTGISLLGLFPFLLFLTSMFAWVGKKALITPLLTFITNIAPKETEAEVLRPHTVIIAIPSINSPNPSGWNVSANIWNKTGKGLRKCISISPSWTRLYATSQNSSLNKWSSAIGSMEKP